MIEQTVKRWHHVVEHQALDELADLLADDVEFYSPIVFTPQRGKDITTLYLSAAAVALRGNETDGAFHYVKQALDGDVAMLEFETTVDGKYVNGIDIIRINDDGRIVEFRVMVRPLQAVNVVHAQMRAMLEAAQP